MYFPLSSVLFSSLILAIAIFASAGERQSALVMMVGRDWSEQLASMRMPAREQIDKIEVFMMMLGRECRHRNLAYFFLGTFSFWLT